MGLYAVKPAFVGCLRPIEDRIVRRRVSPNTLTASAFAVSLGTGVLIAAGGLAGRPVIWLAVPPLVLVRLALNALDGSVARRTRRASPIGTALNEVGDRFSDAAAIGAAGLATGHHRLALGAIACAFFASLAGVLALAITGRRACGGPVGKADRAALLALGAIVGAAAGTAVPFVIVLWAILTGSLATAVVRLHKLARQGRPGPPLRAGALEVSSPCMPETELFDVLRR